jgi:PadR family transcriptional regulator, regulatory protein PadR
MPNKENWKKRSMWDGRDAAGILPFYSERCGRAEEVGAAVGCSFFLTFDIDCRYYLCMAKSAELLQGTLDLLILRTLELHSLHGVGIADRIQQVTHGVFKVGPGSLFPALHRLAEKGWIEGEWGELESGRRAKVYALTPSGRAQLAKEKGAWRKVLTAMNQVLGEEA